MTENHTDRNEYFSKAVAHGQGQQLEVKEVSREKPLQDEPTDVSVVTGLKRRFLIKVTPENAQPILIAVHL